MRGRGAPLPVARHALPLPAPLGAVPPPGGPAAPRAAPPGSTKCTAVGRPWLWLRLAPKEGPAELAAPGSSTRPCGTGTPSDCCTACVRFSISSPGGAGLVGWGSVSSLCASLLQMLGNGSFASGPEVSSRRALKPCTICREASGADCAADAAAAVCVSPARGQASCNVVMPSCCGDSARAADGSNAGRQLALRSSAACLALTDQGLPFQSTPAANGSRGVRRKTSSVPCPPMRLYKRPSSAEGFSAAKGFSRRFLLRHREPSGTCLQSCNTWTSHQLDRSCNHKNGLSYSAHAIKFARGSQAILSLSNESLQAGYPASA